MVTLNKIYTRVGDGGETRLVSGDQVSKADPRVAAYGDVDELNAVIGLARLSTIGDATLDTILARVQNDLFDLGADLATPGGGKFEALRIVSSQVDRLETEIDAMNSHLSDLTSFILPGGSPASAALHLARTVCRRAERRTVEFLDKNGGDPHREALRYLNRLSDLLFVAARHANAQGAGDVLWTPGGTR